MHGRRRRLRWWWGCDKTLELCARVRLVSSSNNESDYSKSCAIKSALSLAKSEKSADRCHWVKFRVKIEFVSRAKVGEAIEGESKGWRLNFKVQSFWNLGEWYNVYNIMTRLNFGIMLVNHSLNNCRFLCIYEMHEILQGTIHVTIFNNFLWMFVFISLHFREIWYKG